MKDRKTLTQTGNIPLKSRPTQQQKQRDATSLVTIVSTQHGRLRREQRNIEKRDLQRALKYGSRTRVWGGAWRVEYQGITFITDETLRREITSFPSPLPIHDAIPMDSIFQHQKTKHLLKLRPDLVTSHTVIVLDDSGSMLSKHQSQHGMYMYRDCQAAALESIALEFVAEQLWNETATNSDLVSLITFDKTAKVRIHREPMGWPLYNQLLSFRNTDTYEDRQSAPHQDAQLAQSNYLSAIDQVMDLLNHHDGNKDQCAVSLLFYSDGCPTDPKHYGIACEAFCDRLGTKVKQLAMKYQSSLTLTVVGLGNPKQEEAFAILKRMVEWVESEGAKGRFQVCHDKNNDKSSNDLSSAISSLATSLTNTKMVLGRHGFPHQGSQRQRYTIRNDLISETDSSGESSDWRCCRVQKHLQYHPPTQTYLPADKPYGASPSTEYLTISRKYCGMGAERVTYQCQWSQNSKSSDMSTLPSRSTRLIAKETKTLERLMEGIQFHDSFFETQSLAQFLAQEFNRRVEHLLSSSLLSTTTVVPRIEFLEASIVVVEGGGEEGDGDNKPRSLWVEKFLDIDRFTWTKWNDNNGMIFDGTSTIRKPVPINVDLELQALTLQQQDSGRVLEAVTEEEEESDDDESVVSYQSLNCKKKTKTKQDEESSSQDAIQPCDFLQAFTHFSVRYTHGQIMVCDLQGVYNTDLEPPTFELTDPAIHYKSRKSRHNCYHQRQKRHNMVYGRTDKGLAGMNAFFHTHQCSQICHLLEELAITSPCRNKQWKRDWHASCERKDTTPTRPSSSCDPKQVKSSTTENDAQHSCHPSDLKIKASHQLCSTGIVGGGVDLQTIIYGGAKHSGGYTRNGRPPKGGRQW